MRASVESVIRSVERDYSPIHWILKPELDLALKLANQIDNQETLDSKLVHECRMILASIRKQVPGLPAVKPEGGQGVSKRTPANPDLRHKANLKNCPPLYSTKPDPSRPNRLDQMRMVYSLMGLKMIPWNEHVMSVITEMEHSPTPDQPDRMVPYYRFVVVVVPRQTGKTEGIGAPLVFERMLLWPGDEQHMLWCAQNLPDTLEVFRNKIIPRLTRSKTIRDKAKFKIQASSMSLAKIESKTTGSTVRLISTSSSAGHGATPGLAIIDEAWVKKAREREHALRPAQRSLDDAQLIIMSTAGDSESDYLRSLVDMGRKRADPSSNYNGRMAFFEWGADPQDNPHSVETWKKACPALGHFQKIQVLKEEHDDADESGNLDSFRRSALNQWVDGIREPVIPSEIFEALISKTAKPKGSLFIAVDAPSDRSSAIVMASDGESIEVVNKDLKTSWLSKYLRELWEQNHDVQEIVSLRGSPVQSTLERLKTNHGVAVTLLSALEHQQACGLFYDACMEESVMLRAINIHHLREALAIAEKRELG